MKFKPIEIPSELLEVSIADASFDSESWFCEVMQVCFAGTYPPGSAGSEHARFMRMWTAAALALNEPDVVLLDLRELTYTWGDGILGVLQVISNWNAEEPLHVVIASSEKCDSALASLLTPAGGKRPGSLQISWENALEVARQRARERSERIG